MKTWQKWVIGVVGVLVLLSGLRQLGVIPRRSPVVDERSRALVGRWAGDSACRAVITFNEDGTFVAHGGGVERWRMNGDRIVMTGRTWRLVSWTANAITLILTETGSSTYQMVRC